MLKKLLLKTLIITITLASLTPGLFETKPAYAADKCPANWTQETVNGQELCKRSDAAEGTKCTLGQGMFRSEPLPPSAGNTIYCRPAPNNLDDTAKERVVETVGFLVEIQGFLNKLIWPILAMNGKLLDNSLLFGNGMEEHLRAIWVPIRDLVNIIFIIVLLVIALYNVLGISNDGNLAIKSALPKVIVGILAVNFSFFIMKVVLDATNVITSAVFSIPTEINLGNPDIATNDLVVQNMCVSMGEFGSTELDQLTDNPGQENRFSGQAKLNFGKSLLQDNPSKYGLTTANQAKVNSVISFDELLELLPEENQDAFEETVETANSNSKFCEKIIEENGNTKYALTATGELFVKKYNSQNAAFLMAVNLGKIVFYRNVDVTSLDFSTFTINTIFSVVLYLVYVISFIVLFVVLLGRLVFLWLSIAISPILLILIASPELKSKLSGLDQLTDGFFKNAFAPIIIGVVMTIGWVMLRAIQSVTFLSTNESINLSDPSGIPIVGLTSLQDFLVAVSTIAVVWIGVFAAAKGTLVEGVVGSIENVTKGVAKFIATAPIKYGRFIPIKDKSYSGAEVADAARRAFSGFTDSTRLSRNLGLLGANAGSPSGIKTATSLLELKNNLRASMEANSFDKKSLENLKSHKHLKDIQREFRASNPTTDQSRAFNKLLQEDNLSNTDIKRLANTAFSASYFADKAAQAAEPDKDKQPKKPAQPATPQPKPAQPQTPKPPAENNTTININNINGTAIPKDHPEAQGYIKKVQDLSKELQKPTPDPTAPLQNLRLKDKGNDLAPTTAELQAQLDQVDKSLYPKLINSLPGTDEAAKIKKLNELLGRNTP